MSKNWMIYKKLHKWPGLIVSFILLYYAITGIIMNHREFFSGLDLSRSILPDDYKYNNWNNAALKGNLILNKDSILVYGNIGIWLTDSTFKHYTSFNTGFPKGSDNRKIFDVHSSANGDLYAATLFGLYGRDPALNEWKKFNLNGNVERFTGIESIGDTVYAINRSYLFKGKSDGIKTVFTKIELPAPEEYVSRVTLFETIWQLHSGEIFGLPGKLFVDLLGIVTAFLSITGIIYFFFPGWIKRRFQRNKPSGKIVKINKWSLKWHNKIGAWTFVFLIVLFFTGIFLRPPLLIAIARANVAPLKYSHLDQPNPWYDKLRDLLYDSERGILMLSTSDGMYFMDPGDLQPIRFHNQPPVSVMGINTFQPFKGGAFVIGSFSGLFLWHPEHPEIFNYINGSIYQGYTGGRPVGDYKITGTITDVSGKQYFVDYDKGVIPLRHDGIFPDMSQNIMDESKMSLWNVSLEIHTGRFFSGILGNFYILLAPLIGLASVIIVISGYLLWKKKYKHEK
jgi:hypothetical protein